jgi:hypothetical protein
MRFENYILEVDRNDDNKPDTKQDRLKIKINKLQVELADQNERMGYMNAKKEQADEKEMNKIDQDLARMAQKADRFKEEIARLKGKL